MLGKEIKKIGVYTLFLAILLIPMLGFPKLEFQWERPTKVIALLVGLLFLNLIIKAIVNSGLMQTLKAESIRKAKWITLGAILLLGFLYILPGLVDPKTMKWVFTGVLGIFIGVAAVSQLMELNRSVFKWSLIAVLVLVLINLTALFAGPFSLRMMGLLHGLLLVLKPFVLIFLILGLLTMVVLSKTDQGPGIASTVGGRLSELPRWLSLGPVILFAAIYPMWADNYMIDVGVTCLIYVCLGLGLNIVVGLCGLLDLGFIAFYAVGAYSYSLLNLTFGLNFWACLPFGIIFGMTVGCIIGYPTLKMRGDYLAIVTMGFGEIIRIVLNNWTSLTSGPNGLFGMSPPVGIDVSVGGEEGWWLKLGELTTLPAMYYLILFLAVLTIIGVSRLDNSRIGRAWVAIREDETAAELSGVPTTWIKLLAYAMGAAFASVAGGFFAAKLQYTNPNFFIFMESCIVLCIVVLGGVGSIPGIIVAAIVLISVPEVFRELENYRMLAFGAIMTIMMVLKPEGLIPAARRKREIHEGEAHVREDG